MTDYTDQRGNDSSYKNGDVIIKFSGQFTPYFNLYTKVDNGWSKKETIFPGYAPACNTGPDGWPSFNATGFKRSESNGLFLILGLGFLIIGIIGTIMTFTKAKNMKQKKDDSITPSKK
jgi:hypothetical protein